MSVDSELDLAEAMRIANIEARNLIRERPEFFPLILATHIAELRDRERAVVFRCAYLVARREDDAIDGDRPIYENIEQYMERHKAVGRQEVPPGGDHFEQLLAFSLLRMERMQRPGDDVRKSYVKMAEAMLFDFQRAQSPRFLSQAELNNYYFGTFAHALNLSLITVGSHVRAEQIPEMMYTQGTLYSIRDLKKDWQRGLYNIPSEVLELAGDDLDMRVEGVRRNPVVRDWIEAEKSQGRADVAKLSERLKSRGDMSARLLCLLPIVGMNAIVRRREPRT